MLKNITFSADERLIKTARRLAQQDETTLNAQFRRWLEDFVAREDLVASYRRLMKELSYVDPGRKFTRDEMNER